MTLNDSYNRNRHTGGRTEAWFWISGVASILLGALAILFPFTASVAVAVALGAILLASGLIETIRALSLSATDNILWHLLFGILAAVAGVILLLYPLQSVTTLTIVLAVFFLLGGFFKIGAVWVWRPSAREAAGLPAIGGWQWLVVSGVFSVLPGAILLFGLPATAGWALGFLIGIDFLLLGAAEIAIAVSLRNGSPPEGVA